MRLNLIIMKNIILLCLLFLLVGCRNYFFNKWLDRYGAYDNEIQLSKYTNDTKDVVFIPMIHLAIPDKYEAVRMKVDSLDKEGYYFYWEKVKSVSDNDTILRKFRKILNFPLASNGYSEVFSASILDKYNLKFKKNVIDQPPYEELGLDSLNSKNVDSNIIDMVNFYENEFGKIELEPCDFETKVTESSPCENENWDREKKDSVIIDYRNSVVIENLTKESNNKIAIVYGSDHIKGMAALLLEQGYRLQDEN